MRPLQPARSDRWRPHSRSARVSVRPRRHRESIFEASIQRLSARQLALAFSLAGDEALLSPVRLPIVRPGIILGSNDPSNVELTHAGRRCTTKRTGRFPALAPGKTEPQARGAAAGP